MKTTEKEFLSYDQQLSKLKDGKGIKCSGKYDKEILVRNGYFNLVNGYKEAFSCGINPETGTHIYYPNTALYQLYGLKYFDDELRVLLLSYITKEEEEVEVLKCLPKKEIRYSVFDSFV